MDAVGTSSRDVEVRLHPDDIAALSPLLTLSPQQRLMGQASNGDVVTVNLARDYKATLAATEDVQDGERKQRSAHKLLLKAATVASISALRRRTRWSSCMASASACLPIGLAHVSGSKGSAIACHWSGYWLLADILPPLLRTHWQTGDQLC